MVSTLSKLPAAPPPALAQAPAPSDLPARVPGVPSAPVLVGMQAAATVVGLAGGAAACVLAQGAGWEGVAPYLLGAGIAFGANLLPGMGLLASQLGRRLLLGG